MIIHANSIHMGGGKVLLDQILTENIFGEVKILICDTRYIIPSSISAELKIYRIRPNLIARWKSESLLKKLSAATPDSSVLCFSNLPPAFRLKSKTILFLQNALLLPNVPLYGEGIKAKLRTLYEKFWLNLFISNIDEIWVQTASMKSALRHLKQNVLIRPILPKLPPVNTSITKKYDFLSVSGSAPHKRLKILLKAWEHFSVNPPSLLIISDKLSPELLEQMEKVKNKNVEIKIDISRKEIFQSYQESKCLILTSKIESYCLPLYEAKHFNLKILAPNEPYVADFGPVDGVINLESEGNDKNNELASKILELVHSLK